MNSLNKFYLIILILCLAGIWSCTKLKNEDSASPVSATVSGIHPADYKTTHSADIKSGNTTLDDCKKCHGVVSDITGGVVKSSCMNSGCHAHSFAYTAAHSGDLRVGKTQLSNCKKCHGEDFAGGIAKVTCMSSTCHVHSFDYANDGLPTFHGLELKNKYAWNLDFCKTCHGADYKGGTVQVSCITCHTSGPEACNVCHGSNNNAAPPKDIDNNTAKTFVTVGAHQEHLKGVSKTFGIKCAECHVVPKSLKDAGHLGTSPAEVAFKDSLANTSTKGRIKTAMVWLRDSLTCKNTYCHGNFTNGNNYSPKWTKGQDEAKCGSCHSLPPGGTHLPVTTCSICHNLTVDANMNIIDKSKHMNGVLNVFNFNRKDW
jgi:predicted CxxxxCH...CXXCH cytochrome family protein